MTYYPYKVLDLRRGKESLGQAEYLAEYDAIVLEPSWPFYQMQPGEYRQMDEEAVSSIRGRLSKRGMELTAFFSHRGVFFATLEEPAVADDTFGIYDDYSWWLAALGLPLPEQLSAAFFVTEGFGTTIKPCEPAHPFETYLRLTGSYRVRIAADISSQSSVTVLAENRAKEPIAIEVAVAAGAAILVPPPKDDSLRVWFDEAIKETLGSRVGFPPEWPLAIERKLQDERDQFLAQMRDKRLSVEKRLTEIRSVKESLFKVDAIDRARTYIEKATSGTPTPGRSLPELRKLVETITDRLGGEKGAAQELAISVQALKRIKRLASDPQFDVLHPPQQAPVPIDPKEFERALKDGRQIFERLLEYEYGRATGRQPSYREIKR